MVISEVDEKEDRVEDDVNDCRAVDAYESGVSSPVVSARCAIFDVRLEMAPFRPLLLSVGFSCRRSPLSDLEP